jgi:hypothetical protein
VTTTVVMVVGTVGFLAAFGLLLWTVHRLKPARFQVKASITKWVSLDIQMQAPERDEPLSTRSRPPRGAIDVDRSRATTDAANE